MNPDPKPTPAAQPLAEPEPSAVAANEDESVLLPAEPVPGAATVETIPTARQDRFVRTTPTLAPVAFGSAMKASTPKAPPPPAEVDDSEIFVLDEVAPIPTESEGVVALDPESRLGKANNTSQPSAPAPKPAPKAPAIPVHEQDLDGEDSIYTVDPEEVGPHALVPKPATDSLSSPLGKIVVPGRAAAGTTASPKAAATPQASGRPAFGSGSHTALVSCAIEETMVEAKGRRPAVRITFVKPGEKSPIPK